jgi:DNA repair protein RecN (Recombination protein N)
MLQRLEIENYILIDRLEIDFHPGFSVITGETGAGKSILLGALELILGKRTDTNVLLDKSRKCTIEGIFQVKEYDIKPFFLLNDLDYEDLLIIRREITPNSKSRAFINDTPVTLSMIKELGERLVNVHSQNSVVTLNKADFQLSVLDSYARSTGQAADFRANFEAYILKQKKLTDLTAKEADSKAEEDYLRFQLEELEAARLQKEEQQELEERINILSHAEEIKDNLFQANQLLSEDEVSITSLLSELRSLIKKITPYHSLYQDISTRLESGIIEIKDIADEIARAEESAEFNPDELARLQDRLDLLYHLQTKHRVSTVSELLQLMESLHSRLEGISTLDEQIDRLKKELETEKADLEIKAGELTGTRQQAITSFELEIIALLQHMGMPDARFEVGLQKTEQLTRDGNDRVTFFFSANKGHELKPLSNVASGGELSRVMLAIKAMISQKNLLPTIIFDEIDNGISGDIAGRVGDILLKTSANMQLLAITHLPQIAGRASVQYTVFKRMKEEVTLSGIKKLSKAERIDELAKMIGGKEITPAARQTARELLEKVSIFDN